MVRGLQVRNGSSQQPKDCFTMTGKNVSRETISVRVMKTQPLSRHHEEERSSDVVIQSRSLKEIGSTKTRVSGLPRP